MTVSVSLTVLMVMAVRMWMVMMGMMGMDFVWMLVIVRPGQHSLRDQRHPGTIAFA
jgi:hypothetical protein